MTSDQFAILNFKLDKISEHVRRLDRKIERMHGGGARCGKGSCVCGPFDRIDGRCLYFPEDPR